MCSNYNLDRDKTIKDQGLMKRGSLWKQICTILDQDKVMADVIAKGMVKKMGSGGSTMFW